MFLRRLGVSIASRQRFAALTQARTFSAASSASSEEVKLLEDLLRRAKEREIEVANNSAAQEDVLPGPKFTVGTFNALSAEGLKTFPSHKYEFTPLADNPDAEAHAILLRSHKLDNLQVPESVRAVARCGSGTNNVCTAELTERGIPVFNTPGSNANAVAELVLCSLLLASRGIYEGINHVQKIFEEDGDDAPKVKKRVEAEKKMFVGQELAGKTLGVIGLGKIGTTIANAVGGLGMNVIGYDPSLSLDAAWSLRGESVQRAGSIQELLANSDGITLHVPYMEATHHLMGADEFASMKPGANLMNFSRAELVDSASLRAKMDQGAFAGKYICDFADEWLHDHPRAILLPHLGASTGEAESNSASMAADAIINFIEYGNIKNSVNFPNMEFQRQSTGPIFCCSHENRSGLLNQITSVFANQGVNIVQQRNASRGDAIAYTVVEASEDAYDMVEHLNDALLNCEGMKSSRVLFSDGRIGGYAVKH